MVVAPSKALAAEIDPANGLPMIGSTSEGDYPVLGGIVSE
jgi:hypothetical protein